MSEENKIDAARQKLKRLLKHEYPDYINSTLAGDFAAALVDAAADKNKIDDGGPAFPLGSTQEEWMNGMTLRDYFAAKAMQELMALNEHSPDEYIAMLAYKQSDGMLKARQQ